MGLIHWISGFPAKSKSSVEVHPIFLGSLGWFFISQWEWLENLLSIQREHGQHRGDNSWERGRDLVSPPDCSFCSPVTLQGLWEAQLCTEPSQTQHLPQKDFALCKCAQGEAGKGRRGLIAGLFLMDEHPGSLTPSHPWD